MIRTKMYEGTILETNGNEENIALLNKTIGDMELTEQEERTLIWLSQWEKSTVENVISILNKIKNK
jgi:hypothetical protein